MSNVRVIVLVINYLKREDTILSNTNTTVIRFFNIRIRQCSFFLLCLQLKLR